MASREEAGGAVECGTVEEDGPVIWEILTISRGEVPGTRGPGEMSPTRRSLGECTVGRFRTSITPRDQRCKGKTRVR